MTNEPQKPDPLTVVQERALRFIAGASTQHYIRRTVNLRTLTTLIDRGMLEVTKEKGVTIYTVTEAGKATIDATGPVAFHPGDRPIPTGEIE